MKVRIGPYKNKRTVKVEIEKFDTWSMDCTLALIIHPMLVQLKATKHGSPYVKDADVPEDLKSTSAPPKKNEWDTDDNHHKRWDYVLDEMIFAFKHLIDDSWTEAYSTGTIDLKYVKDNPDKNTGKVVHGPNHTYKLDSEGLEKVYNRIDNGLRLFATYYRGLWD